MGHGGRGSRTRRHARRAAERAAADAPDHTLATPARRGPTFDRPAEPVLEATGTKAAPAAGSVGEPAAWAAPLVRGRRRESGRARQRRQRQAEAAGSPLFALKLEACRELGLEDKLREVGWGGLSAAEAGRVGAYVTRMLREVGEAAGGGPQGR